MKNVKLLILGAGGRGRCYAGFVEKHPDRAEVVGVADPREWYRNDLAGKHNIAPHHVFIDWKDAADYEKMADAVIISTHDAMHVEPAVAFAERGYHILLEKPMAPDPAGCRRIVDAVVKNGVMLAVGHVLRYTNYTQKLKGIIEQGRIGDVVSVEHLEPVGFWHQAHSFVRGNWRNESESSSMLIAKSCHDIDWLRHIIGVPCRKVSSFGSLKHFRKEEKPEGAGDRCFDCDIEADCVYSAKRLYLKSVENGITEWPVDVLTPDPTSESITEALQSGPYGRCVYECDNDVVDHQVVILEYEGGTTASFTMTAFNQGAGRKTRIFGTRGEIKGDSQLIQIFDFSTEKWETINTESTEAGILGGHGGGDDGLIDAFISAVASNDPSKIISGPEESLETHLTVFAAEQARLEGRVIEIQ